MGGLGSWFPLILATVTAACGSLQGDLVSDDAGRRNAAVERVKQLSPEERARVAAFLGRGLL